MTFIRAPREAIRHLYLVVRYPKDVGIPANIIGNTLNYDIGLSWQATGCSESAGSEIFRIGKKYGVVKIDGFVKSLKTSFGVIPAKAGIQCFQILLDACLRRHDGISDFLRVYQDLLD